MVASCREGNGNGRERAARERAGLDAREALIDAAEELFAARGIEGPSLREINLAAGQRNKSSLHYHFGSREGLLRAILARHGASLQQRRIEAFERLVGDEAAADIARIAEVILAPVAEFLRGSESELAYLIISAELLGDPSRPYDELEAMYGDPLLPRLVTLLLEGLDIPQQLAEERVLVAIWQAIDAIAGRARLQLHPDAPRRLVPLDLFVSNLVDMLLAAITAPVSARTREALALQPEPGHAPRADGARKGA